MKRSAGVGTVVPRETRGGPVHPTLREADATHLSSAESAPFHFNSGKYNKGCVAIRLYPKRISQV